MNQTRPFYSTNTNITEESYYNTTPSTFNGQNVLISQEFQRKIYDILNTSIVGTTTTNSGWENINFAQPNLATGGMQPGVHQAQKNFTPGGILFSFSNTTPQTTCACNLPMSRNINTIEQQIGINNMQNQNLSSIQYQEQLKQHPFQVNFHLDACTSSSDLLNAFVKSKATPDFTNLCGINPTETEIIEPQNSVKFEFPPPKVEFTSNARKLTLSKKVVKPSGHVADLVDDLKNIPDDPETNKNQNTVKFSDETLTKCLCEKAVQVDKVNEVPDDAKGKKRSQPDSVDEICDTDCCKNTKSENRKKGKRKCKENTNSESDLLSSSCSETCIIFKKQ